ncbi:MAG: M20/M25/M40 family metallo-hydrolase, partial [Bdellovibrionales bacterium]|nr:M20/M25/M40 family metallo-hydrolase [Bdellovibrionales bacterium]
TNPSASFSYCMVEIQACWGFKTLRDLVQLDTTSGKMAEIEAAQKILGHNLQELGFSVQYRQPESGIGGPLLVAELAGQSAECISLIGHVDTVLPPFAKGNFQIDPDKRQVRGSGVIDNKGSLIVGLSGLRSFLSGLGGRKPSYTLRVVSSPNEEVGSTGWTGQFRELGQSTKFALGLEPALEGGHIIAARRGNRWYDVQIKGREAHAGRSYGHHVNAAHDLAMKIVELQKLNNYRKHMSVSVGHVEGGRGKHNVVCGNVDMKLDVRFATKKQREKLQRAIEKILMTSKQSSVCKSHHSKTRFEIVDDCPPFAMTFQSKKLAKKHARRLSELEGKEIKALRSGGAGDINYFAEHSHIVLDGLGAKGFAMHSDYETIELESLWSRSHALSRLLKDING